MSGLLESFIREILSESRIREAEVTGGKKVKHGGREHKSDLKRRIKELEWAAKKHKRGSEARANYVRILSRLKRELKRLEQDKK